MAFTGTEKAVFGIGVGLAIVGIAYAYIQAKKTVDVAVDAVTGLGGILPTPGNLAATGGQIVAGAGGVVGSAWDLWKSGANIIGGFAGLGPFFPGDLDPAAGSGGGYWDANGIWVGDPYATGALPTPTPYTGELPTSADHPLVKFINRGTPLQITDLYSAAIWTVGRAWRGEIWSQNDWGTIMKYLQSGFMGQDPILDKYLQAAVEQQQTLVNIGISGGQGGDNWVDLTEGKVVGGWITL